MEDTSLTEHTNTLHERPTHSSTSSLLPLDESSLLISRCPVCQIEVSGGSDVVNQHVDLCLASHAATEDNTPKKRGRKKGKRQTTTEEEEELEGVESYTWAGTTRIRACSMLEGGMIGVCEDAVYLSLPLSVSLYLCPSVSVSLYLSLCLIVSLCLFVYLCLSASLSLTLCLCVLSLSLCISVDLSLSVSLCLSIFPSQYFSLQVTHKLELQFLP